MSMDASDLPQPGEPLSRTPRHVGLIPDGNRRWAAARGLRRGAGYEAGIGPGLRLLQVCRQLGIEEVSIYGFTKENTRRPAGQVEAFRTACVSFAKGALEQGAALLVVGDAASKIFPEELRPWTDARSPGDVRVNLLANYGWHWDLHSARARQARTPVRPATMFGALASRDVSRIDLVIRWGGRRRLSGFLPLQSAYADFYIIDSLWPDMRIDEFRGALAWYQEQDVTLGG